MNTCNLHYSHKVPDHVSHPHETISKTALYTGNLRSVFWKSDMVVTVFQHNSRHFQNVFS